jgi:hypothetical protein
MHLIDVAWLVIPASVDAASPRIPWADIPLILAATAGIGGICTATFLWYLKQGALIPLHDPSLTLALEHSGDH